jgi:hypothetical protein
MAYTADIIPISATVQEASKPLPDIGLKEKDFKNRKQFLNARSRAAGYANYNQWLKARRSQGVEKRNKGGRRPDLYAVVLQDYRLSEGGIDEGSVAAINAAAVNIKERDAIESLREMYYEFEALSDKQKNNIYTSMFIYKYSHSSIDEIRDFYRDSDNELVLAITRKDYLIQSAFLALTNNECKNLDDYIRTLERYSRKEII